MPDRIRAKNWALCVSVLFGCLLVTAFAAGHGNLSGTYLGKRDEKKGSGKAVVKISQTDSQIEVTLDNAGKTATNIYPLDGSTVVYTTETGLVGKALARWKGEDLVIETFVPSPPVNGKAIRFHTTEHWRLSSDGKTLKVRTEIDSPDIAPEIVAAAFEPFTETYHREQTAP
jgi:hypothetical protein